MKEINEALPEISEQDMADMEDSARKEADKFREERRMQNASWLLEDLLKNRKIEPSTKVEKLLAFLEDEKKYYSAHYGAAIDAQGLNKSATYWSGDELARELDEVSGKEADKSTRMFYYCNDAISVLNKLVAAGILYEDTSSVKKVQSVIKQGLTEARDRMLEEEEQKSQPKKEWHEE